jgi:hypothetical protein
MLQTGPIPALQHAPIERSVMSPIFPCRRCGTFIERSTQHYRSVKGQVLCSSCLDAQTVAGATVLQRLKARLVRPFQLK